MLRIATFTRTTGFIKSGKTKQICCNRVSEIEHYYAISLHVLF